jgi:hypothetical protein
MQEMRLPRCKVGVIVEDNAVEDEEEFRQDRPELEESVVVVVVLLEEVDVAVQELDDEEVLAVQKVSSLFIKI